MVGGDDGLQCVAGFELLRQDAVAEFATDPRGLKTVLS